METTTQSVLIVDDDPDVLLTASELFKMMGFTVLTAKNGLEAINVIESDINHIDVLFSDIFMTNGIDGISLSRSVRKNIPNIKIILCSGYPQPAEKVENDLNGFVFLKKPYGMFDLVQALRSVNFKPIQRMASNVSYNRLITTYSNIHSDICLKH